MFFSRFIQEQSAKPLNKKDHLSQFTSLLWKQINIYIYNYNISIYLSIHLSIYLDIATSFLIGEPSTFMGHPYHSYITTLRKLHPQPKGRCKALRVGNAEDVAGSPWKTYNIFLVSMDALFYWIWIPLNGMGYLHGSLIWISKRLLNGIIGAFEFFGMDLHGIGIPCSWAVIFPIILNWYTAHGTIDTSESSFLMDLGGMDFLALVQYRPRTSPN